MRWELLFDDLEAQIEAGDRADLEAELRDRFRAERGRIRSVDRLRAAGGCGLDVFLRDGGRERGHLLRSGPDWLLLEPDTGREVLIPLAAAVLLGGLPQTAVEPGSEGLVASRLDLRHVLRGVARDRSHVTLSLDGGFVVSGVLATVAADHLEMAVEATRSGRPLDLRLVPLSALVALRRVATPSG